MQNQEKIKLLLWIIWCFILLYSHYLDERKTNKCFMGGEVFIRENKYSNFP